MFTSLIKFFEFFNLQFFVFLAVDFNMKRAIVSVISDLVTDQRVNRTSITLCEMGYQVTMVGRELKSSLPVERDVYKTKRFRLWFERGPFFYAAYNIRLFVFLLLKKADLLVANDLDTLLPNYLISRLKRIPLIYDSHEYFTEVPELQNRVAVKKVWLKIEEAIIPKLKNVFTVNESIAGLYKERYGVDVKVIRNVPVTRVYDDAINPADLHIPHGNHILIFQGSGINVQRGAEEAVEMMKYLEKVTLLFVGGGDVVGNLKQTVFKEGLQEKVKFIQRQTPQELRRYTAMADIGLSLDKDSNINYRYSLPNKLFDYIHAGVPVLASDLPEVRKIVEGYQIGLISDCHEPRQLADLIRNMLSDKSRLVQWKENLKMAAQELCWEKEKQILIDVVFNAN